MTYEREPIDVREGIPIFSQPDRYTDNYEKISGDHLRFVEANGHNPWIPEDEWRQMEVSSERLIRKYVSPSAKILDVGVGLGRLLGRFPDMQRFGVDISFAYLRIARDKGIEVCYSLIEELPYQKNLFDAVICTDVLEHVLGLDLCCQKILGVLKPGGYLIVRVPNREDLASYLSSNLQYKYVHVRRFDESGLRLLFERVLDCEVIEVAPGAYVTASDRLKCQLLGPFTTRAIGKGLRELRKVSPPLSDGLLRKLYFPSEINIVVKKPL